MAVIINSGANSVKNDLAEIFDVAQQQRVALIEEARNVGLVTRALFQLEAERLKAKGGADDPRVQAYVQRADSRLDLISALQIESEIAQVQVPSVERNDTLIHGRILNPDQRAVANVDVRLVDAKGAEVAAKVVTDASGYYSIVLSPAAVAGLADKKLFVSVGADAARVVPASAQPITLTLGSRVLQEVPLNASELGKVVGGLDLGTVLRGGAARPVAPKGTARRGKRRPAEKKAAPSKTEKPKRAAKKKTTER